MGSFVEAIVSALAASGHVTLDDQARALGIPRSTAWTIISCKHKTGRLSKKVVARMLNNPDLPSAVRTVIEGHLGENFEKRGEENAILTEPRELTRRLGRRL